jgi:3-dehydroquinate synthase
LRLAADDLARRFPRARAVVISDARVARLYGRSFARRLEHRGLYPLLVPFPSGERSKTRETKARLEDRLVASGVGRDSIVLALGGGVTGDLAGFLAATWHRGVPLVSLPTTLLAMVDAGLGGKTAVDLPGGKNLVGAFHHPVALWADLDVLRTLPPRVFRGGLAEAVKTAVALDAALFRRLETEVAPILSRDPRAIGPVVTRCLALKGALVASDPRDAGRRGILNLGHTVAHAVEAATDYRVGHGDAVAIGLAAELGLACRLTGFPKEAADRVERLLRAFGLPVRPPRAVDPKRLLQAARRDKKTRSGIVRCVLPEALGRMPDREDPSLPIDTIRDLLPFLRQN